MVISVLPDQMLQLSTLIICSYLGKYLISVYHPFRYIPLSRVDGSLMEGNSLGHRISFPSLSSSEEVVKVGSTEIVRSKLGSVEAAAKVW